MSEVNAIIVQTPHLIIRFMFSPSVVLWPFGKKKLLLNAYQDSANYEGE